MKILELEVEGFGPFKETQRVDFTSFDDHGIFLIGGRTGAGKTTILDAICFALYGNVPRYERYSGAGARLRSDHCESEDVTRVTLTFAAGGDEYRIVRSPEYERPKQRGTGTTLQHATVELAIRTGTRWETIETKASEVAVHISAIVKLNLKEFLQVILLAQNRFQEFLEADSGSRQSLLRTLFATQRFDDYAATLSERAATLGEELKAAGSESERLLAALLRIVREDHPQPHGHGPENGHAPGAARGPENGHAPGAARGPENGHAPGAAREPENGHAPAAEQGPVSRESLGWAHACTEQLKAAASAALAREREAQQQADQARIELSRVRELDSRQRRLRDALEQLQELSASPELTDDERAATNASARARELAETLGALAQAREREQRLPQLEAAATAANDALAAHDRTAATFGERRKTLIAELTRLDEHRARLAGRAGGYAGAEEQLKALQAAYKAATEAARLREQLDPLRQSERRALTARDEANTLHSRLLSEQLHGQAAILAATLTEGDPCPVCGAREHPAPARADRPPVTDEQVTAAQQRLTEAQNRLDQANAERTRTEAEIAALHGSAGERTPEQVQQQGTSARAAFEDAQEARQQLEKLPEQRERITAAQQQLADEEAGAAARRNELLQAATTAADAVAEARRLIAEARGEHATVGVRIELLDRRRRLLEQLAAVTTVLDQPDLQNLPAQPADLTGAEQRQSGADAALKHATVKRVQLEKAAADSVQLTARLEAELVNTEQLERRFAVVDGLARTIKGESGYNQPGIPLESFVLAAELEQIVAAANTRLRTMSQGRYTIEHSTSRIRGNKRTGLEIVIYDAYTGATRVPQSLSGGEKFLASLALALGLSEIVTSRAGGLRLDTLFIDEGFGSLDAETLEIAMQTLDQLRQGGRTVGLISHVEAMKDQIPAKLLVDIADNGSSVITASS